MFINKEGEQLHGQFTFLLPSFVPVLGREIRISIVSVMREYTETLLYQRNIGVTLMMIINSTRVRIENCISRATLPFHTH